MGSGGTAYKPSPRVASKVKGGLQGLAKAVADYRANLQDPRKVRALDKDFDIRYSGMGDSGYYSLYQKAARSQELATRNEEYKDNSKMEHLLSDILVEMRGANTGINKFNEKELSVNSTPVVITDNSQKNVVVPPSKAPSKTEKKPREFITSSQYAMAKRIASGAVYS